MKAGVVVAREPRRAERKLNRNEKQGRSSSSTEREKKLKELAEAIMRFNKRTDAAAPPPLMLQAFARLQPKRRELSEFGCTVAMVQRLLVAHRDRGNILLEYREQLEEMYLRFDVSPTRRFQEGSYPLRRRRTSKQLRQRQREDDALAADPEEAELELPVA